MPWAVAPVRNQGGTHSTVTVVPVTPAAAVTLLQPNSKRVRATLYHDASTVLYIKLGSGASSANFTYKLVNPGGQEIQDWWGVVTAIKGSGNSNVIVTEVTL